jgi:hypothetical protein
MTELSSNAQIALELVWSGSLAVDHDGTYRVKIADGVWVKVQRVTSEAVLELFAADRVKKMSGPFIVDGVTMWMLMESVRASLSTAERLEAHEAALHQLLDAIGEIKHSADFTLRTNGYRVPAQMKAALERIIELVEKGVEGARKL